MSSSAAVEPWNHIGRARNRSTGNKKRLINTCFSKELAGPMSHELLSDKLSNLGHQETQSHVVKGTAKGSSRRLSKMVLWDTTDSEIPKHSCTRSVSDNN